MKKASIFRIPNAGDPLSEFVLRIDNEDPIDRMKRIAAEGNSEPTTCRAWRNGKLFCESVVQR